MSQSLGSAERAVVAYLAKRHLTGEVIAAKRRNEEDPIIVVDVKSPEGLFSYLVMGDVVQTGISGPAS